MGDRTCLAELIFGLKTCVRLQRPPLWLSALGNSARQRPSLGGAFLDTKMVTKWFHSTRLETRTKESTHMCEFRVAVNLYVRSESDCWDFWHQQPTDFNFRREV